MSDLRAHFTPDPPPKKIDTTLKISGYVITKRYRHWELVDPKGELVCITVYKCGAKEVVRRLLGLGGTNDAK